MNSPIALYSSFVVNRGGTLGLADTNQLRNPFKTPMLLDEIRFTVKPAATTFLDFGGVVRVKFSLGRNPLTNGFVPIALLGRLTNKGSEFQQRNTTVGVNPNHALYTWRLPRPLYLPPDELVIPQVQFSTDYSATDTPATATVDMVYAGRSLPSDYKAPKVTQVPWVAAFLAAAKATAVNSTDESTEADLVNATRETVFLEAFRGRIYYDDTALVGVSANDNFDPKVASKSVACSLAYNTNVRMFDSLGRIVVRDSTPFSTLFQALDRTWQVNTVLPPQHFFIAQLDENWASYGAATGFGRPQIAMIGYRDVELANGRLK